METVAMNENTWSGKNVFVTGSSGFLGAWVTEKLIGQGANVVTLLRDDVARSYFHLEGLDKKVTTVRGSLEDYLLVERILNEYEIETCFHLAAQTIVGTANRSPLSTFESNIRGTWNVLEAARNSEVMKAMVVASTDKVYGESTSLPYRETDRLGAKHPYDVSKACVDMLCSSYFHTYGLSVAITRCGNIFGGGDLNFNRIVPGTIRSALIKERPVIRSDGKLVRDYVYVEDIADANILLADTLLRGREKGEAFNFSLEQPQSVIEVTQKILSAMNSDLQPIILNQDLKEINKQYLSSEKARARLGWKPKWTFDSGIRKTIDWYKKFINSY
ncbi:MAG: GDP-mannose 4,6-dehydratase [Candidatus Aenigmarchaeota archaeon]|nr:GDP-mannose 4,6-dehydratase [Candidatus Aenigmarchaeota archaeon]